MRRPEASSFARALLPRLLLASAAVAIALHAWIGRWSLVRTNVLLPTCAALGLLLHFWAAGALVGRLRAFGGRSDRVDPLATLVLGVCASVVVVLALGAVGLLRTAVFV